ncbi:MAG: amidohydrolase family protein, partial [Planctomycetota bacterium]
PATPPATPPVTPAAEPAKKELPKWDVANPPGELSKVAIDADEGTWISLDVSPDGKTIVFDMLGDLYTIPFTGGEATCIASGIQWDMQPRFSPDGKSIAFVSDRTGENGKGGDNIWAMNPDGSSPRQISKETYRLLTQPVWTPDSKHIIARKHFTSRRSLGAGEMWMYDAAGKTDGLALTTKQSEQKDTGEPAVSPDGRYLYYSLDATPGGSFEYDKDSNPGIYAIDRLDMVRQTTERIIAGPGGACRPTPSPGGKSIAFVKRVRYRSELFVQDLASGIATPIYEAMERDNQETWAVHGVYPAMAWTPDGKSLVFWAAGKIRKVDVATKKAQVIPFHVKGERTVAKSQRVAIDVHPEKFDVKMLRNVVVSPKGDKVAYQALGHIYLKDLPAGEPKRLTTQTTEFEFFPTWSRDGSMLAFTTWNDETLGAVKVVTIVTGKSQTLTSEPGRYIDPAFAPGGNAVVFGRVSGGYLTTPVWSYNSGVYIAKLSGGDKGINIETPRLLTKRGTYPQFGSAADRLFLSVRDGGSESDNSKLISIDINGLDEAGIGASERTHYKSDWATEFAVSPDGATLAFTERFNVYTTPFLDTGRSIDIGPKSSNTTVIKLSSEAGQNIQWSGDSKTIYWSLGPELYTAALPAPGATPAPATKVAIGFSTKSDIPVRSDGKRNSIALVGARIITMETDDAKGSPRAGKIIENGTIVIVGNKIEAVGPADQVQIPADADKWDCKGKFIMPGIVDVHAHGGQSESGLTPQRNWIHCANLAFGVTTIHDPSNGTEGVFAVAELARAGMVLSPRTFSTGTILYGATGAYKAEIDSLEDAEFHLQRMKAVGAFSVKSYNQPRRDQRQMVLEAARKLGMMVVPEGGALFQHNMTMVVDGHTTVEHTLPIENIYGDVAQLWGHTTVGYTPTLGVAYGGMGGENYWYAKTKVWENARLMTFVPRYVVDPRSRRRSDAPDEEWNHIKESALAKRVLDAREAGGLGGGGPTLGAHGQLAGLAAHWEMAMFVQGGMSPFQALRAGTIDGAWVVGLDAHIGSIKAGKLADFIILSKDPTQDIANTQSIATTVLNGRLYDAMSLREVAPLQGARPKLFFEDLQRGAAGGIATSTFAHLITGCAGCGREGGCDETANGRKDGYK